MFTIEDLETRIAVGRSTLRLAVDSCERFPGFSRSVFVIRANIVTIEFGVFGGEEGTLRIQAEFATSVEALEQGLVAAGRDASDIEYDVVVDGEWLPDFPEEPDLVESERLLRESLAGRDPNLFPSARFSAIADGYWVTHVEEV